MKEIATCHAELARLAKRDSASNFLHLITSSLGDLRSPSVAAEGEKRKKKKETTKNKHKKKRRRR